MYTVTIRKEHFTGSFLNSKECPLALAIKEQLPDYPLKYVGAMREIYLLNGKERQFYPNREYLSPGAIRPKEASFWGSDMYWKMKNGEIKSFEVYIEEP